MVDALRRHVGKTLRLYTISATESYLGTLEQVTDQFIILRETFSKEPMYIAVSTIEAFKEVVPR